MLTFVANVVVGIIFYELNIVNGIDCNTNAISIDLSGIETDWYDELTSHIENLLIAELTCLANCDTSKSLATSFSVSAASTDTCDAIYFDTCSLSQFDFTGYVSVDTTFINNLPDMDLGTYGSYSITEVLDYAGITAQELADLVSVSVGAVVESEFCGNAVLCNIFAGGTNSCQKLSYDFSLWIPSTCDASADYNEITLGYEMNYYYACCDDTDDCNDADVYDFSVCEDGNDHVSFVNDLTDCWQDIQVELATYLFCTVVGDVGSTADFINGCTDGSGDWASTASGCTYQLLCTNNFQELLSKFASCACSATTSYGYDADIISRLMGPLWSMYCGNINIECEQDGSLDLTLTYWNVDWTFSLDLESGDLSGDSSLQDDIISSIATTVGVDTSLVSLLETSEDTDDTTQSSVTIQVKTDSSSFSTFVESSLASDADSDISSATGYDAINGVATINITTEHYTVISTATITTTEDSVVNIETTSESDSSNGIAGILNGDTWDAGRAFGITVFILILFAY